MAACLAGTGQRCDFRALSGCAALSKSVTDIKGPKLQDFLARFDFLWVSGGVFRSVSSLLFVGKSSGFE